MIVNIDMRHTQVFRTLIINKIFNFKKISINYYLGFHPACSCLIITNHLSNLELKDLLVK